MSVPLRSADMPTQQALARALGRLATYGLRRWWILEKARLLLGLDCVRAHLPAESTREEDYADALRSYLDDAVQRMESPQYRTILEVVLGTGESRWNSKNWRKETAKVRRTEAGRRFRPGEHAVSYGTIRQHHEPRAVSALAEIVWADERRARGMPLVDVADENPTLASDPTSDD
jgi:hypothetical protein